MDTQTPARTTPEIPETQRTESPIGTDGRDREAWAAPVERLALGGDVPTDALNLNVTGRRLVGPVQGFGRLWQKSYRVSIGDVGPDEVIRVWKSEFGSFWPKGNRFYGPLTGIAPGEVALLNLTVAGGQVLSTGVMVIYADHESFTFMTPEGHMFAAWITFSAAREAAGSLVQIQVLLRANDPIYEVVMALGGHRQENEFWLATLVNLGRRFGTYQEPAMEQICVDRRRQWRNARNVRYNAAIRSSLWTVRHPLRALQRRRSGR
jgi:hypothetical protein